MTPTRKTLLLGHRRAGDAAIVLAMAAVVAGVVGSATLLGLFDALPLLDGTAAGAIEVLGAACLAVSWLDRERSWLRGTLPALLLSAAALTAAVAAGLRLTRTVTDPYPARFAFWVGMAVAALVAVPVVVRRAGVARRLAALLAVPLTALGAVILINQEYGVWPRMGDLLGHTRPLDPVPALTGTRSAVARLGAQLVHPGRAFHGGSAKGEFVALDVPAKVSRFPHRPGGVYLPPAYFGPARAHLPVLVMLAGTPGTPTHWIGAGRAQATIESYASAHRGVAPVLILVDQNGSATGDTECVDRPRAEAETFLTVDVPAFVTGTLGIGRDPSRWGVVGFSEGGTCALDLVLAHPDLFRHAVDIAGDAQPNIGDSQHTRDVLFQGSTARQRRHDPQFLLKSQHYTGVTAWFAAGTQDPRRVRVAHRLARLAAHVGVTAHEFTAAGGHNWQFAAATFAHVLPQLGPELVPPTPTSADPPPGG